MWLSNDEATPTTGASLTATEVVGNGGDPLAITQTFSMTASGVTNIRFNVSSNHSTENYTGISDVGFDTVAVPEPSSTALLGLGGLALILRRRK